MSRHGTFRDKDGNAVSVDLGEVWTPANVLERIRHEEGERLNADTVSKRLAEAGDTRNRSEGEPLASIWTDEEREQIEAILSRRFGGLDAAGRKELHDMEVDLEAEVMREEFDRRRQVEAELTELNGFRESAYVHHCRNRTGETLEPAVYEKMRAERAQLEEDTIELALRLTSANRPALGTGPQAYLVGMLTGETKPCINVRKRAILPTVAAEKRAPNIKALEFLLSQREHRFDQFCTFTHGQRVPIDPVSAGWELRQAFADKKTGLHRRLSKLAAAPFMAEHGAEMIFRASEIGGLKGKTGELIRDEKGRVTAHPHAHCLIHFKRWLPKNYPSLIGKGASAARKLLGRPLRIKRHPNGSALMVFNRGRAYLNREGAIFATGGEMGEWTRKVWAFWGSHWSIDGAIEKVREACKYVVKPNDQKALDAAELAALDIGLFGLHRVQPMGELREQVRHRRESCLKIVKKWRTVGGERTLVSVVVPDWNARKRDRKETLEAKRRKKNRAKIRQAMKAERRRTLAELNAERKAKWREEHAAFLAKHAQGDLFAVNTSEPPAEPAELTELPFPAFGTKRADKEPATFRNRIVARLAPAYYFGRVSQPALMVWSDRQLTRADIEGMLSQSFVRPAIEATADQFAKAKRSAAQVSVHTSPVTVRGQESRTPHLPALLRPGTWQKQAEPALC